MERAAGIGWIEIIAGVMFSGKSEELIRRVRRALLARKEVRVFKSYMDIRYAGARTVNSHDGGRIEAEPIQNARTILSRVAPSTEVVAIDEAQFLDPAIVAVVNALADSGRRVIIAGTELDFRGQPFGPMPDLLAIADQADKLHAICMVCGGLATRSQRLIDGRPAPAEGPTIHIGGLESYEARCRACHEVPTPGRDQFVLLKD
jgi:thymidine kinase